MGKKIKINSSSLSRKMKFLILGGIRTKMNVISTKSKSSFLDDYPKLKTEWDWEKNGDSGVYPWDLTRANGKKVWWRHESDECVGGYHRWYINVYHRTGKKPTGCPICCIPSRKICCSEGCNSVYNFPDISIRDKLRQEWCDNRDIKTCLPGSNISVRWVCNTCGYEWKSKVNDRTKIKHQGCMRCGIKRRSDKQRKSPDQFAKDGARIHKKKYTYPYPNTYINDRSIVTIRCPFHGNFRQKASNHLQGTGCRKCGFLSTAKKRVQAKAVVFVEKSREIHGNKYDYSHGEYKTAKTYYNILCTICTKFFPQTPNNHLTGHGCPHCNFSKLQKEFNLECENIDIGLIHEARFDDCKEQRTLPFDAYLPDHSMRVELQGQQHFTVKYHHYKTSNDFIKRIHTDNKKSLKTYQANESFLSISHLCLGKIKTVLEQFLNDKRDFKILCRYYITDTIYLEYGEKEDGSTVYKHKIDKKILRDDKILQVYQFYAFNVRTVKGHKECLSKNFIECKLCDEIYSEKCIQIHYNTEQHLIAQEKRLYELSKEYNNLFSITENGIPIILKED